MGQKMHGAAKGPLNTVQGGNDYRAGSGRLNFKWIALPFLVRGVEKAPPPPLPRRTTNLT